MQSVVINFRFVHVKIHGTARPLSIEQGENAASRLEMTFSDAAPGSIFKLLQPEFTTS